MSKKRMELLRHFCGTDPDRPSLHHPFLQDGWVYATDGHLLIRLSAGVVPDVGEVELAPDVSGLLDALDFQSTRWMKMPVPPPEDAKPSLDYISVGRFVMDGQVARNLANAGMTGLHLACTHGSKNRIAPLKWRSNQAEGLWMPYTPGRDA